MRRERAASRDRQKTAIHAEANFSEGERTRPGRVLKLADIDAAPAG